MCCSCLEPRWFFDAEGSTRWESMSFDNCGLPMQRVEVLICPPLIVETWHLESSPNPMCFQQIPRAVGVGERTLPIAEAIWERNNVSKLVRHSLCYCAPLSGLRSIVLSKCCLSSCSSCCCVPPQVYSTRESNREAPGQWLSGKLKQRQRGKV